jgi:hypothetical protein
MNVARVDEVEEKLKNSTEEFEAARKEAKDARDRFNKIKQERFSSLYVVLTCADIIVDISALRLLTITFRIVSTRFTRILRELAHFPLEELPI